MLRLALLTLALAGSCTPADPPGAREGRAGNAHLRAERADDALAAYAEGLAREPSPAVRSALHDHAGLAHALAGRPAEARGAFEQAAATAPDARARARAAFHGGNAAVAAGAHAEALAAFRRALLNRPDHEGARRNFELLALGRTPPPEGAPPEPSAFARDLKARADALVAQRRYAPALELLRDGLRIDSTVAAYQSTIERLEGVVGIEEGTR